MDLSAKFYITELIAQEELKWISKKRECEVQERFLEKVREKVGELQTLR